MEPIDVKLGVTDEIAKRVVKELGLSHIEADAIE